MLEAADPWTQKVLIVDDDTLLAALVVEFLRQHDFQAEMAHTVKSALNLLDSFDPDIVLMDVHLGAEELTGIQLARRIYASHPHLAIVFLSNYPQINAKQYALPENSTYISKASIGENLDSLLNVLNSAHRGETLKGSEVSELSHLSEAQLDVLKLAAMGLNNNAIAERRGTKVRTVEEILRKIYIALDVPHSPETNPRVTAVRKYIDAAGLPKHREGESLSQ